MNNNNHIFDLRQRRSAALADGLQKKTPAAKIDYFTFSSNQVYPLFISDRKVLSISARPNKWYHQAVEVLNLYVNFSPKTDKHKNYSYRFKSDHGIFDKFLYLPYSLPVDGITSRLDICIDCFSFDEALSYVTQKNIDSNFFSYVSSPLSDFNHFDSCLTFYFGNRKTSCIFERVYFKPELGVWRYEVEFKPKSNNGVRGVGVKHFKELHHSVQDLYTLVHTLYYTEYPAHSTYFDPVSRSQRIKLTYFAQLFLHANQHEFRGALDLCDTDFYSLAKYFDLPSLAFLILTHTPRHITLALFPVGSVSDFLANPVLFDANIWISLVPVDITHIHPSKWRIIYELYYQKFLISKTDHDV